MSVGLHARRQDPRVERAADDDADALFRAERQKARQGVLVEQRVAPGDQENIELARARELFGRLASR